METTKSYHFDMALFEAKKYQTLLDNQKKRGYQINLLDQIWLSEYEKKQTIRIN